MNQHVSGHTRYVVSNVRTPSSDECQTPCDSVVQRSNASIHTHTDATEWKWFSLTYGACTDSSAITLFCCGADTSHSFQGSLCTDIHARVPLAKMLVQVKRLSHCNYSGYVHGCMRFRCGTHCADGSNWCEH